MTTDPLFDLSGKVAVVTGGLGQLGVEYTLSLVNRGAQVAIFDPGDPERVDSAAFQDGVAVGTVRVFNVDITSRESVETATASVSDAWGVPHICRKHTSYPFRP